MPRAKPWLKMWVEWLDDPKMLRLTLAEQACWWRLVSLAQRCTAGGSLITSSGSPLTSSEIAANLHITSPDDLAAFNSMLKKMEAEGSLFWNTNTLHIVHFVDRQEMAASETPEAIRERVKRFRERQRVTQKPLQQEGGDVPVLAQEVRECLLTLPHYESYLDEHEAVKKQLNELGKLKGYIPREELTIPEGRIDICWERDGNIAFAFEVDAQWPKYKSLIKLRSLGCISFVILRRNHTPYKWEQDILLIGLGRPKLKDEPDSTPPHTKDIEEEEEEEEEISPLRNGDKPVTSTGEVTEKPLPDPLGPVTPASKYLFEKTGRKRWQNLVQKELFETTEAGVGEERMKQAINWALASGIANIKSICTAAKKGGERDARAIGRTQTYQGGTRKDFAAGAKRFHERLGGKPADL